MSSFSNNANTSKQVTISIILTLYNISYSLFNLTEALNFQQVVGQLLVQICYCRKLFLE